jgi:hypothetical protein
MLFFGFHDDAGMVVLDVDYDFSSFEVDGCVLSLQNIQLLLITGSVVWCV